MLAQMLNAFVTIEGRRSFLDTRECLFERRGYKWISIQSRRDKKMDWPYLDQETVAFEFTVIAPAKELANEVMRQLTTTLIAFMDRVDPAYEPYIWDTRTGDDRSKPFDFAKAKGLPGYEEHLKLCKPVAFLSSRWRIGTGQAAETQYDEYLRKSILPEHKGSWGAEDLEIEKGAGSWMFSIGADGKLKAEASPSVFHESQELAETMARDQALSTVEKGFLDLKGVLKGKNIDTTVIQMTVNEKFKSEGQADLKAQRERIVEIDLSDNELNTEQVYALLIDQGKPRYPNLRIINLSKNALTETTPLAGYDELRVVTFDDNPNLGSEKTNLRFLKNAGNLTSLSLARTGLEKNLSY